MKTITICPGCNKLNKVDIQSAKEKQPTCGHCQKELPIHGAYSELSAVELKKLISSTKTPVVVDFWAPWCGPCKAFGPNFEQVAEQEAENFAFVKINTQVYPDAGEIYGVRGIPTLALFKNGQEDKRISGAMSAADFKNWIK